MSLNDANFNNPNFSLKLCSHSIANRIAANALINTVKKTRERGESASFKCTAQFISLVSRRFYLRAHYSVAQREAPARLLASKLMTPLGRQAEGEFSNVRAHVGRAEFITLKTNNAAVIYFA